MPSQTQTTWLSENYVISVRHVYSKHKVEPKVEGRMSLTVALLTCMLTLNLPPVCGGPSAAKEGSGAD